MHLLIKRSLLFSDLILLIRRNHLLHDVSFMPLMAGVSDMVSYRFPSNDKIMFWSHRSLDIFLSLSDQAG